MKGDVQLPEHIRSVIAANLSRAGGLLAAQPGTIGLMILRGHPTPDRVTVQNGASGAKVGVIPRERAKELAAIRNASAAARLDDAPTVGNRWVMILDNDLGVYLCPLTVPERSPRGGAPGTHTPEAA